MKGSIESNSVLQFAFWIEKGIKNTDKGFWWWAFSFFGEVVEQA